MSNKLHPIQVFAAIASIISLIITVLPFFGFSFTLVTIPVFAVSGEAEAVGVPLSSLAFPFFLFFAYVAYATRE